MAGCSGGADTESTEPPVEIVTVSISDAPSIDEGQVDATLDYRVTLSASSDRNIDVSLLTRSGSASSGADFVESSETITIPAGATSVEIGVPIVNDGLDEPDETVHVDITAISSGILGRSSATGTIVDDDAPVLVSIASASTIEGEVGLSDMSFSVSLSSVSGFDVAVDFTTGSGTATEGTDYQALSGTVSIPAGSLSAGIGVSVIGDLLDESNETITLVLSSPVNSVIDVATATGTIVDDDAPVVPPSLEVSVADAGGVVEGGPGAALPFVISLSTAVGADIAVQYASRSGSAISGIDFIAESGTVSIAAGNLTAVVAVPVIDDVLDEVDEVLFLDLVMVSAGTLSDASAVGTISDDDGTPSLSVADATRAEGNSGQSQLSFVLSLSAPSSLSVTVGYATANGTAIAGSDYTAVSGTATLAAGATQVTVNVPVLGDLTDEVDESFTLTLTNPTNATLSDASAVGTISDDDGTPSLSVADATRAEGNSGQSQLSFVLSLSAPSSLSVTVGYATANGTAIAGSDYTAVSGTATLAAGATQVTVNVPVLGDLTDEVDESFTLSLSTPTNATLSDASAVGTISDDDNPGEQSGLLTRPSNTSCIAPDRPTSDAAIAIENAFPFLPALVKPVALIQAPEDPSNWFVVEQDGRVLRFTNNAGANTTSTFIDIRSPGDPIDVDSGPSEGGLLGMAFHPDYGNGNRYVYLSYTLDGAPLTSVIARFESKNNGASLDATDATVLMTLNQPFDNHNGGQIAFGQDGYLYIGFGDGGSAGDPGNRAQNTSNLFGSMLRIDVNNGAPYAIPFDNPFAGNPLCSNGSGSAACPEIYAWGLRNPWKWSFDATTDQLWLGDVGQNAWEEVDLIELGGNYGWRCREGAHNFNTSGNCPADLIDPIIEYSSSSEGDSITGGNVYRGSAIPELSGRYIFADYVRGKIFASVDNGDGTHTYETLLDTNDFISAFAAEPSGELLYLNYIAGTVRRIVQAGGASVNTIPEHLSETGCVNSNDPELPASGLIPYDINVPFWSDGAVKERWYAIPDGETIDVNAAGDWLFPNGTVLMKHFRLNGELIETRLFMRHTDGEWAGYTYEWNASGTDADRVIGGKVKGIGAQDWIYPSESQCMQCHTAVANFSLGIEHGQLNRDLLYPSTGISANQLHTADFVNLLDAALPDLPDNMIRYVPPDDLSGTLEERARSYLHSNCAGCHRPGGPTPASIDLRWATPLNNTATCNVVPTLGSLGISNARIIMPGDASSSVLVERASRRDSHGMPPLGSNLVDADGVQLLIDWIDSLSSCP